MAPAYDNDGQLAVLGTDLFGNSLQAPSKGPVAERFLFSPFTVLDARQGDWQDRKRAWASMGIESELGRRGGANMQENPDSLAKYGRTSPFGGRRGGAESYTCGKPVENCNSVGSGTSIFDPVLCELAYRWWCPEGGQVVDPFAGGSVRGIVAGALGLRYWGCDLSQVQIDANRVQHQDITPDSPVEWVCGDSMDKLADAPQADLMFTCPPYGNLERYSDDPRDLSTMEYHTFLANYKRIIMRACARLKQDRFACIVVGDFRDKAGHLRDFVSATVQAFTEQGLKLYNEAILVTAVGSAAMRVTKQFKAGRKLVKLHQNFLVFVKGDWRRAAAACRKAGDDD